MTTKKKAKNTAGVELVAAKVGDPFTYLESETIVEVTHVHDDGTVDVQEPEGQKRYWGCVPGNVEWLGPVE